MAAALPRILHRGRTQLAIAGAFVGGAAYHTFVCDVRATAPYAAAVEHCALPLLQMLDPEDAHRWGVIAAACGLAPLDARVNDAGRAAALSSRVFGLTFRNPVGLAAGFDKQAEAMPGLLDAGFGFVEVGTVTPLPQPGNPRPRMFRLSEDRAVINRFGFNSDGAPAVVTRLQQFWGPCHRAGMPPGTPAAGGAVRGVIGVNFGKNKDGDAVKDYVTGAKTFAPLCDYLTVNVSSPNTPGLRALQGRAALRELLAAVIAARDALPWSDAYPRPPLLVKVAPDLSSDDLADIAAVALELRLDGIIVSNTTLARPATLASRHAGETGGLSGRPLLDASTAVLARLYVLTGGRVALVGVGGVDSGEAAYAKIRAGASLVQLYTALAYEGTGLVPRINERLVELLRADGFDNISQAVGADHRVVGK